MPNKFDKLVDAAAQITDEEFNSQFTSLTRLTDAETDRLITDTGISKENLAKVLKEVKDATASNEQKAAAIQNITNGVAALIAIAKKFL